MYNKFDSIQEKRDYFFNLVSSCADYTKKKFDEECQYYLKAYRHEFTNYIRDLQIQNSRIDVNIIYPQVKTLIPNIYFRDPKVFIKPTVKKIYVPTTGADELGNPIELINPETGQPMIKEYDAAKSAHKLEALINTTVRESKFKYEIKQSLVDAHLLLYGAIKCGFGNDQGVASMGADAPPSTNESVNDNLAYAVRLEPWNVIIDPWNFYSPSWIAVKYCVPLEQLQEDPRLKNTELLKGNSGYETTAKKPEYLKNVSDKYLKFVEYFEIYVKPCAGYPRGQFLIVSKESPNDFLYEGEWPYEFLKNHPIKIIYFNRDPEGGFPVPDVRYYAQQQKAKINMRNALYETVQRSVPITVVNTGGIKDRERFLKQMQSGQVPKYVESTIDARQAMSIAAAPGMSPDFYNTDAIIDNDVARTTGLISAMNPVSAEDQLATSLKIASSGEAIRQNERTDIVSDLIKELFVSWFQIYQEFLPIEGKQLSVEGAEAADKLFREEIQGQFIFDIKPFSMTYEDPAILRKQYVDLLNLLASPELRAALAQQGIVVKLDHVLKRILETYQEKDVENFIDDSMASPESQILDALQENQMLMEGQGMAVTVEETDNDKIHILVHQLVGGVGAEHIMAHNEAMLLKAQGGTPGGGNQEGLPVNGVAASQEQMMMSAAPSMSAKKVAINREATREY